MDLAEKVKKELTEILAKYAAGGDVEVLRQNLFYFFELLVCLCFARYC
jgi:hypothetical protein